jgi:hypothetical protein
MPPRAKRVVRSQTHCLVTSIRAAAYAESVSRHIWRGYIDIITDPLYHFGFGLSYTSFACSGVYGPQTEVGSDGTVVVSTVVENNGRVAGDEGIQFYVKDREARVTSSVMELVDFKIVNRSNGGKRRPGKCHNCVSRVPAISVQTQGKNGDE